MSATATTPSSQRHYSHTLSQHSNAYYADNINYNYNNNTQPLPQDASSLSPLFTVDGDGSGNGMISSPNGDVYSGSFSCWQRHGYGVQRWATGEMYEGTWKQDKQWYGVFTDRHGDRWQGDFIEKKIKKLERGHEQMQQQQPIQQHHTNNNNNNLQRSVSSASVGVESQPADSVTYAPSTHEPPLTQRAPLPPRHKKVVVRPHTSRRYVESEEEKQQRLQAEAHAQKAEAKIMREFESAQFLLGDRFRVSVNGEGSDEVPGPGLYSPSLSLVKRSTPRFTMSGKDDKTGEVALIIKGNSSPSSYNYTLPTSNDPTKPSIPSVSLPQPTMLPTYVKESDYFKQPTPAPTHYDVKLTYKGGNTSMAAKANKYHEIDKDGNIPAYLTTLSGFGSATRSKAIPLYISERHMRVNMGKNTPAPTAYNLPSTNTGKGAVMLGKSKEAIYQQMKNKFSPSGSHYTPSFNAVDKHLPTSTFGSSRAYARPTYQETPKAVLYSCCQSRANEGMEGPGPAAYSPNPSTLYNGLRSIGAHTIPPNSKTITKRLIQMNHPLIDKIRKSLNLSDYKKPSPTSSSRNSNSRAYQSNKTAPSRSTDQQPELTSQHESKQEDEQQPDDTPTDSASTQQDQPLDATLERPIDESQQFNEEQPDQERQMITAEA